jgi:hypothetical protein
MKIMLIARYIFDSSIDTLPTFNDNYEYFYGHSFNYIWYSENEKSHPFKGVTFKFIQLFFS